MDLAIIVETMVILGILGGVFVMIVIFIRIVSAILGGGRSSKGGTKGGAKGSHLGANAFNPKLIGEGVGAALKGAGDGVAGVGRAVGAAAGGIGKGTSDIIKAGKPKAESVTHLVGAALGGTVKAAKGAKNVAWKYGGKQAVGAAKRKAAQRRQKKEQEKELQKQIDDTVKQAQTLANQLDDQAGKPTNPFAATAMRWKIDNTEDAKRVGAHLLGGQVKFAYQEIQGAYYLVLPQTEATKASQVLHDAGVQTVEPGEACNWLGDEQIVTEIINEDGTVYQLPDNPDNPDKPEEDQEGQEA